MSARTWWTLKRGSAAHLVDDDGRALCGRRVGLQSEGGAPTRILFNEARACRTCDRISGYVPRPFVPPDPESETP